MQLGTEGGVGGGGDDGGGDGGGEGQLFPWHKSASVTFSLQPLGIFTRISYRVLSLASLSLRSTILSSTHITCDA